MSKCLNDKLEEIAAVACRNYPFYQSYQNQSFSELPVVDKLTINTNPDLFQHPFSGKTTVTYTSGTTGTPFKCIKNASEKMILSMRIQRHRKKWGLPLRHSKLLLSNRALDDPKTLEHYAKLILECKPQMIQGRCSSIHALADFWEKEALSASEQLVFFQNLGEPLLETSKAYIEQIFQVPIHNSYGMEEMWCFAFSNMRGELEVDEDLAYVEILNSTTGLPVPEGEYGEVVVTSYVMRSILFLRYRTGDIGRLIKNYSTGKKRLQLLPIRTSHVQLKDRRVHSSVFRYLDRYLYELSKREGIRQYQVVQETFTSFKLLVVTKGDIAGNWGIRLKELLRQWLDSEISLTVETVPSISPHPVSGKYMSFVSLVSEDRTKGVLV